MGENSKIAWTHHTFNPWWGCENVSPGCAHCYAEAFSNRLGNNLWGSDAPRKFFSDKHWNEPLKWDRDAERDGERRRVFCASMADIAEERSDLLAPRLRTFRLAEQTRWLDWLFLTKRPENVPAQLPASWRANPPKNVWWGATVENNRFAIERLRALCRIQAAVRFISGEPLLEQTDFRLNWSWCRTCNDFPPLGTGGRDCSGDHEHVMIGGNMVHGLIVGGESSDAGGPSARPFNLEWAEGARDQCDRFETAFFMKQAGSNPYAGRRRLSLKARKGDDISELPEELRYQELPRSAAVAPLTPSLPL
jgi:protein gp37